MKIVLVGLYVDVLRVTQSTGDSVWVSFVNTLNLKRKKFNLMVLMRQ